MTNAAVRLSFQERRTQEVQQGLAQLDRNPQVKLEPDPSKRCGVSDDTSYSGVAGQQDKSGVTLAIIA